MISSGELLNRPVGGRRDGRAQASRYSGTTTRHAAWRSEPGSYRPRRAAFPQRGTQADTDVPLRDLCGRRLPLHAVADTPNGAAVAAILAGQPTLNRQLRFLLRLTASHPGGRSPQPVKDLVSALVSADLGALKPTEAGDSRVSLRAAVMIKTPPAAPLVHRPSANIKPVIR